jgi:tripartite-type tricarboxylate transporter receptor subunit TctC
MSSIYCRAFAIACAAIYLTFATQASCEDFYKGKQIKLIIGSGEASGVDILGRIAARHLPKHIPGNPVIVAQNMPAPESIAVANHVYNIATPDGLTIGAGSAGLFSRAISQPNIRFDLSKFTWLSNIYSATVIIWMRTDFPCQTFEELRTCPVPLKFSATARGSTGYGLVPELMKDAMKMNMDIIYGYRNADADLAVARGETHASGGDLIGFMGGTSIQLMNEKKVKILVQVAGRKSPQLEQFNTTWAMDVVPEEQKKLFAMLNPILDLARPYFTAPDTPKDRTEILRTAFVNLVDDQAFRDEVARVARIEPTLTAGSDMADQINVMLNQPEDIRKRVIELLQGN